MSKAVEQATTMDTRRTSRSRWDPAGPLGLDADAARFARAEAELRRFWRVGQESLRKQKTFAAAPAAHHAKAAQGPKGIGKDIARPGEPRTPKEIAAARLGWNPQKLRQARLFSHRCSEKELDRRIREAGNRKYAPHWTILVTVYHVSDIPQREAIWRDALTHKMSLGELERSIRAQDLERDNRVRMAGRRVRAPRTAADARHRVREAAEHLLRIEDACRSHLRDKHLGAEAQQALFRAVTARLKLRAASPKPA